MRIRLFLLFLFISVSGFSQKSYLDSLWHVWSDEKQPDTSRLNAIYDFAWEGYLSNQPDSAYYFSKAMLSFSKKKGLKKYEAKANNLQGTYFYNTGDYTRSMESNIKSLDLMKEINDKKGIAAALSNIGVLYKIQGDLTKAIDFYSQSLKIKEELGDQKGIGVSYNNIGSIYNSLGDCTRALYYFNEGLKIWEKLGDKKGIAGILNNIGMAQLAQKDYVKALESYDRSLKLRQEIDDKPGIAKAFGSIGSLYFSQKEYEKAIDYCNRCLELNIEVQDKQGQAIAYVNLGSIYLAQKDYPKAILYLNRGLKLSQDIGAVMETQSASDNLYSVYKLIGKNKEALEMHELFVLMRDSISSDQSKKEIVRQEFKYQYEKKAAADSVKATEEKKVVEAQFKQEQTQRYVLYGGVALMIVFAGFMFNRFRVTQRQKELIELQKQIVEQKQKEVLDSIYYAKRIQQSLLPTEKYIYKSMTRLKKS